MISLKLDFEAELNRCVDCANGGAREVGGGLEGRTLTMVCWLSESPRCSFCTAVMARRVDGVGEAGE